MSKREYKPPVAAVLHKHMDDAVYAGPCVVCDRPTYCNEVSEVGEVSFEETKLIKDVRFIGIECVLDLYQLITVIPTLSDHDKEKVKEVMMEEIKKNG